MNSLAVVEKRASTTTDPIVLKSTLAENLENARTSAAALCSDARKPEISHTALVNNHVGGLIEQLDGVLEAHRNLLRIPRQTGLTQDEMTVIVKLREALTSFTRLDSLEHDCREQLAFPKAATSFHSANHAIMQGINDLTIRFTAGS